MNDSPTDEKTQTKELPKESPLSSILASLDNIYLLLNSTVALAQAEALLTLRNIPSIIFLSFLSPLLLTLAWLGASVTVSWLMADAYQHTGWGLFSFTLCQGLGYLIVRVRLNSLKHESSMPHTREHLSLLRKMTVPESNEKTDEPSSVTT